MAKETNYTPQEKKTLRKMFWNSAWFSVDLIW
mgnify:CR=1 FL=1